MKVMHICSYYYGSKLFEELFGCMKNIGCDFSVFAPYVAEKPPTGDLPKYIITSPSLHSYNRVLFHHRYKKVFTSFQKVSCDFDMVHAHSLFSNGYVAYLNKKKNNVPYVVAVRNTDVNIFFRKMLYLRPLGVKILKEASAIVFLSPTYREETISRYVPEKDRDSIAKKSFIIPNGINNYWLDNKSFKEKKDFQKLDILFVGNIDENKNLTTTIACCDTFLIKNYNVTFHVVGPIISSKIENLIKEKEYIQYYGKKNKEEVREIMSHCDIFIMPSKYETFGLVYAEAMSQGIPVIYSKGQGFDQQFAEGEVGYHITYNDSENMYEKIKSIIENYDIISQKCYKNCDKFNWLHITNQYLDLYTSCSKKGYDEN